MDLGPVDILLLHEWIYDSTFVDRVVTFGSAVGLSVVAVGPADVNPWLARFRRGRRPRLLIDRASDAVPEAAALAKLAKAAGVRVANDPDRALASIDKARMHIALMTSGVHVPHTIVFSPLPGAPCTVERLRRLGNPFVLKPARGSGGEGVILNATGPDDVNRARAAHPDDAVLAQERVVWTTLDGLPAYFRVLYCMGDVYVCFWNPDTHRYTAVTPAQQAARWHARLVEVGHLIARGAHMDLFSTELAVTPDGRCISVDYVNDMCDLRLATEHGDGVPDAVVEAIARRLVATAREMGP